MNVIRPSDEQKNIIKAVSKNKNIIVDAVAGSGKTTTVLFCALKNKDKKIIQITYNSQLKIEVRKKVEQMNINNIEIHTYHSLAVKFYKSSHHDENAIKDALSHSIALNKQYDILIIDEVQDMTPNYYKLIHKFIKDLNINPTILVLGDQYQSIYDFKNADKRFLTLFDKIYTKKNFDRLPLKESYRVTKPIADFVNNVMIGSKRIVSNKEGGSVIYLKKNKYMIHNDIATRIKTLCIQYGYKPDDFFILAPSLKSTRRTNELKQLENALVKYNMAVYYSTDDDTELNEKVIKNKIVFSTFHQAKGRERKIVIIYDFDDSYFKYYCRDVPTDVCPSTLYVAVTRASEILILIHHKANRRLPFLKYNYSDMRNSKFIKLIEDTITLDSEEDRKEIKSEDKHTISVIELTKYLDEDTHMKINSIVEDLYKIKKKASKSKTVNIPLIVKMNNELSEDVSNLNGLVIPSLYEKQKYNISTIERIVDKFSIKNKNKFISKKLEELEEFNKSNNKLSYQLLIGNLYLAFAEGIHSKLKQINKYDWLNDDIVKQCHKHMKKHIESDNLQFEYDLGDSYDYKTKKKFFSYVSNTYGEVCIRGTVDIFTDETIWELKCVNSLTLEHLLQLLVYAWIYENSMKDTLGKRKYKILNIRTGELKELKYNKYKVEQIMEILFEKKYSKTETINDNEFINKCIKSEQNIEVKTNTVKDNLEIQCIFDFDD